MVPIYLGLCQPIRQGPRGSGQPRQRRTLRWRCSVAIVHTAAMIAAGGCLAWLVYRYLGVKFVSRSWFNLETVWAVSLVLVGAIGLVLGLAG